ncbi:histidine phosphatase family protein [Lactobacillus sp. ESL0791]|uniref:histidine phosphatase family protein n=1 Tax=Lactobacillus sp. ESL0791 TaxID=2983234 RepID=UPI0023F7E70F|nr:histidine phosphatase family protein [Lactobacillus sp. ESL0791]MDF7638125.1 histidine phosphatase family protein [Lactobacillus sp. ESL0791]
MEIVFVRHGQTALNKKNYLQGASVNLSLDEDGRKYAEKAAAHFDPSEFDVVYSSPLKRAVETAKIFTKGQRDIILDERLTEFDFGEWDAKSLPEIRKKYPDAIDPWGKVNKHFIKYAKKGETFPDFDKRCGVFLDDMAQKYPENKVLVICHGTLIRMMAAHYLTHGDMNHFETIDNCALVKFSVRDGVARMNYYNRKLI